MSREQQRAADRERECACIFGTQRVIRKTKYEKAPDVLPFELADGTVVQPEVKNGMKRLPKTLVAALDQAKGYTPEAVPVAVFSDVGGHAIACVDARRLAAWMGVEVSKLEKPLTEKKRRRRPLKQLEMFESSALIGQQLAVCNCAEAQIELCSLHPRLP